MLLILAFTLNVSAESQDKFYVYGKETNALSKILNMSAVELKDYVEYTDITYLAVNKDNTKQIKMVEYQNEFSKKTYNFLNLRDNEILELTEDLTGIKGIKGEVFEKGKYKFLKTSSKTQDSGGEFVLNQYITVSKGKVMILNFYTAEGQNTDYIEEYLYSIFGITKTPKAIKVLSVTGIILFSLLAAVVLFAIIKDTFYKKEDLI